MRFEFTTATRIIFGSGTLKEVGPIARRCGLRALVVTGSKPGRAEPLIERLNLAGIQSVTFPVAGEPEIETVEAGVASARQAGCDHVISFGGGSAVDAGKAIAAMLTNPGELLDYLEIIGRGQSIARPPAPFVAIPTTAGTGAEVTRNAVLASPQHRVKVSLRSPLMLPRIALVDPELTAGLPRDITAATGLDALTQLIEPYVSCRANPMTDALCSAGIPRAACSLRKACEDGHDIGAREDMALSSLWSGMALANAGLGAAHGLAGPIGGMFPAPHGAVCAALLPHVIRANLRALRQRQPDSDALRRFVELARLLAGGAAATADEGVRWVEELVRDLKIPPLSCYGIGRGHIAELVSKAAAASSMKGNPLPLTPDELTGILFAAL
jgi:alcohol dehydrogenase class IV